MPIYDYRCKECNKTFDLLVRADTVPACPECGSQQLEKLVSVLAPHGKSADILKQARAQAAREGHFSNYKKSELKR
jgi:putative FmdB family regulatory protein